MIGFERLTEISDALGKNGNLDATKKEELIVFLKEVLEGSKEGETSENIVSAFREKLKNELKADQALKDEVKADLKTELIEEVKTQLKADQALKDEVKADLKTELIEEVKTQLKADQATITAAKAELKTEDLKAEAKNELKADEAIKTEAKNELKADQALRNEVKNGLEGEIKQKVSKFEDLEKEKKDLENKLLEKNEAAKREKQALEEQLKEENKELKDSQQTTKKDEQINTLTAQVQQLQNATLKDSQQTTKQIKTLTAQVQQLQKEKKDLEAKNKTTEQPKQGNGARYTATVGMGLAAGLVAFIALERTVRLEMLVVIAVASALVFGGITYAVLPGTQVDGAKAQEVNENGKSK